MGFSRFLSRLTDDQLRNAVRQQGVAALREAGLHALFSGITTISGAVAGRNVIPYWGFMLALGIGEVLLSFWLLARPGITLVAAVLAIGLWALIVGVTQIIVAIDIKRLRDQGSTMDRGPSDMRRDLHHANA